MSFNIEDSDIAHAEHQAAPRHGYYAGDQGLEREYTELHSSTTQHQTNTTTNPSTAAGEEVEQLPQEDDDDASSSAAPSPSLRSNVFQ